MTRTTMSPTRSASAMPAKVSVVGIGSYRPTPTWRVMAAANLRVKNPARIKHWAETYPPRVAAMLRAMVLAGDRSQAEHWMTLFEGAFIATPESWTGAYRIAVASDTHEDVRRSELAVDRSAEAEDLYLLALRRQAADTQRAIRALEARKAARA